MLTRGENELSCPKPKMVSRDGEPDEAILSYAGAPPWRGANCHNMHKILEDANRLKPETEA